MAIQEIRRFNRFYTNLIGALDYGRHLHTPYTLTEARVLHELADHRQVDAADLRLALSLDAGYLSRLLAKFEDRKLITRGRSERDPRRQRVTLTPRGREAAGLLEERSRDSVGLLLDRVRGPDRARLLESMATIRELLGEGGGPAATGGAGAAPRIDLRTPRPGELGLMVQRNAELYAREYGFDLSYEALVARIVAEFAEHFDPRWDRAWTAELDGRPVGQVMCVRDGTPGHTSAEGQRSGPGGGPPGGRGGPPGGTARLRLLLVEPEARGHGIGARLVAACTDFARSAGYAELVLWTNSMLTTARHLYERAGFELVAERPHHSFGQDLVGQDWRLRL